MFNSVLYSFHCKLVYGKKNNYEIGGTKIKKYTKISIQLSYTKRSIYDPKSEDEEKSAEKNQQLEKRTQDILPISGLVLPPTMFFIQLVQPSLLHQSYSPSLLRAGNPTLRVASLIQSPKEPGD